MNHWLIFGLIVLILGIVISNIMLVRKTANHKFGSSLTEANRERHITDNASSSDSEKPTDK